MNSFDRFFHQELGASRAYLFRQLFLIMLAFDAWILMTGGRAASYGYGFNVAHFGWLDALIPVPTQEFYIGMVM